MRLLFCSIVGVGVLASIAFGTEEVSLEALLAAQEQLDVDLSAYISERDAELSRMHAELSSSQSDLAAQVPPGIAIGQIREIGEQRKEAAERIPTLQARIGQLEQEIKSMRREANAERHARDVLIAAAKGDQGAQAQLAFFKALEDYRQIVHLGHGGHLLPADKLAAWRELCNVFAPAYADQEPLTLVWSPIEKKAIAARDWKWFSPSTGMEFAWIEALGSWVGRFPVSVEEYREKVPSHPTMVFQENAALPLERQPVTMISGHDAANFAHWITNQDIEALPVQFRYRLPTSREWRFFAREEFELQGITGSVRQIVQGTVVGGRAPAIQWKVMPQDPIPEVIRPDSDAAAARPPGVIRPTSQVNPPNQPTRTAPEASADLGFRLVLAEAPPVALDINVVQRRINNAQSRRPAGSAGVVRAFASADTDRQESYAERRRQRLEEIRRQREEARQMSEEEVVRQLREHQLRLIREGRSMPLPIPLTPEEDAQLVDEGILPPLE